VNRSRVVTACVALMLAVACYPYPSTVQISPPQIVRRAPLADLQLSTDPSIQQSVDIDVVIDPNGVPVMSTFKVVGSAAAANHDVLYRYIQGSSFRPGLQNGQPVSANYHTRMQFRTP